MTSASAERNASGGESSSSPQKYRRFNGKGEVAAVAVKIGELLSIVDPADRVYRPPRRQACAKVVFTPDESYFAWVCDSREILFVPWNKDKNCLLKHDATDADGKLIVVPQSEIVVCSGYPIHSIAFGFADQRSRRREKQCWTRFDFRDNVILATGHANGRIRIWEGKTEKLLLELMDHRGAVTDLAFARDGSLRLVSASADHTLKVWDMEEDGNMFKTLEGHGGPVRTCVWSPNSKLLASAGVGRVVYVWDMNKYTLSRKLEGHMNDVVSCAFSPDGAVLATASWDTKVITWDPYTGDILQTFCHTHPPPRPIYAAGANYRWVKGVAYSKTGDFIATISDDGYIRFWNLLNDQDPEAVAVGGEHMISCGFSPSGQCLAVGTSNFNVSFYSKPLQEVPSLLHLARTVIRKFTVTHEVDQLEVPTVLKVYLKYRSWV